MKQIFLQSELFNDIEVVEVDECASLPAVRQACLARVAETLVAEELFFFIEDDDDEEAFIKLECISDNLRLHLHRLKSITVQVRYAGREAHHTFRPSTTIARVKRWAAHEFGVTPSDAAELMLQIAGTDVRPDPDLHLGSLVKKPEHSVCFDLVPAPRVNG
jgi:hypothetical protein